MALRDLFRRRPPKATAPAASDNLFAAREQLRSDLGTGKKDDIMILAACSMRYYVFNHILNGRINDAAVIQDALERVDMYIPNGRLRLATLQLEAASADSISTVFDLLRYTVDQLSDAINMERLAHGAPRVLAHLTGAQGDNVCLLPLLEDTVEAAYFMDYFQQVNQRLQTHGSWQFTACISEEFTDLSQLARVYFDTRRIHELLVDAHAEGCAWLVEEEQHRWEPKSDLVESVWWIEPMRQYVMEHYANPDLNISFLAQQFGISSAYVGRKFREVTGIGLLELIHRCRLTELERRLDNGEVLKDAAAAAGYSSLLTMQRARERYSRE